MLDPIWGHMCRSVFCRGPLGMSWTHKHLRSCRGMPFRFQASAHKPSSWRCYHQNGAWRQCWWRLWRFSSLGRHSSCDLFGSLRQSQSRLCKSNLQIESFVIRCLRCQRSEWDVDGIFQWWRWNVLMKLRLTQTTQNFLQTATFFISRALFLRFLVGKFYLTFILLFWTRPIDCWRVDFSGRQGKAANQRKYQNNRLHVAVRWSDDALALNLEKHWAESLKIIFSCSLSASVSRDFQMSSLPLRSLGRMRTREHESIAFVDECLCSVEW